MPIGVVLVLAFPCGKALSKRRNLALLTWASADRLGASPQLVIKHITRLAKVTRTRPTGIPMHLFFTVWGLCIML